MKLTPLESNRWNELASCWSDDRLVDSLKILLDPLAPATWNIDGKLKALGTLHSDIFHQQTTYPATYIAVPHLIDTVDHQCREIQLWIIDTVAWISTQGEPYGDLTDMELASYRESLKLAADKSVSVWKNGAIENSSYSLSILAAIAALHGGRDLWLMMRLKEEELYFECPCCREKLLSAGLQEQDVPNESLDDYLLPKSKNELPAYFLPIKRQLEYGKIQRDVQPLSTIPGGGLPKFIFQLAVDSGQNRLARWMCNYFGTCRCPACDETIDLFSTLLG